MTLWHVKCGSAHAQTTHEVFTGTACNTYSIRQAVNAAMAGRRRRNGCAVKGQDESTSSRRGRCTAGRREVTDGVEGGALQLPGTRKHVLAIRGLNAAAEFMETNWARWWLANMKPIFVHQRQCRPHACHPTELNRGAAPRKSYRRYLENLDTMLILHTCLISASYSKRIWVHMYGTD